MKKDLTTGLIAIVVMTVFLGLVYPLAITGISQVVFPGNANGSLVKVDGKVVGSSLIGQEFKGKALLPPPPLGDRLLRQRHLLRQRRPQQHRSARRSARIPRRLPQLEKPYDHSLTSEDVPVDAVTQSASGVDPHISEANARIQAHRIAAVRHLPLTQVEDLISAHTDGRFLGVLGEPGVNVLELNIALDKEAPLK